MKSVRLSPPPEPRTKGVPDHLRPALAPVAKRVFWWGNPEEWLDDAIRFSAQVMTFGDLDDIALTLKLVGDSVFQQVLQHPPPGVFDIKSWTFWHCHYNLPVPPLPTRNLVKASLNGVPVQHVTNGALSNKNKRRRRR
ncbi:MAG: hypothetical protein C5B50_26640 [Verrucomicrobia bacterium]|nr:MAG: hypothetical protein C5B50_26640 [Verrucomicrobiota bacterium]